MQWKKKIIRIGNSKGIYIPSELLEYLGIDEGDELILQDDVGKHGKFVSFWSEERQRQESEKDSKMEQ